MSVLALTPHTHVAEHMSCQTAETLDMIGYTHMHSCRVRWHAGPIHTNDPREEIWEIGLVASQHSVRRRRLW